MSYSANRRRATVSRVPLSSPQLPPDRNITDGLAPSAVQTIKKPVTSPTDEEIKITDLSYIGSFNWVEASVPTIIVPGSPPEWRNKATPYAVTRDTGSVFVDQCGYRTPSYPLLSLMTAVDAKTEDAADPQSGIDWPSIDFITDRNGLRKLLRWIGGSSDTKEFRIDTQLAGKNTVLLNRWEKRFKEDLGNRNFSTFGFNFEKASTKPAPGCERGTAYHRIVKYDLNGLEVIVRFEVDACISTTAASGVKPVEAAGLDDLADTLAGLNISPSLSSQASSARSAGAKESTLNVIRGGSYKPQASIVELTTLSERRRENFEWSETFPQLFLSQTPHHFLGLHDRGKFITVEKRKLGSSDLRVVERNAQANLKALKRALELIKDVVVEGGQRGRLSLVCRDGEMKVYERISQESCLPEEIMERFEY